jgi:hypothetical protein
MDAAGSCTCRGVFCSPDGREETFHAGKVAGDGIQKQKGLRAGNEDDSMSDNTKAGFLSAETKKAQGETAKLIADLADVQAKCAKIIGTDGDAEKQTEALTPLYAKRDLLTARLARAREALFTAVVADARAECTAAVEEVALCTAKAGALRDLWKSQVQLDVKDSGARKNMQADSRYWPRELRDVAADKAALQGRVIEAARRMQAVDWDAHAAARARDAAIPIGGWQGRDVFWNRAAAMVPELGSMTPERTGTLVFGR